MISRSDRPKTGVFLALARVRRWFRWNMAYGRHLQRLMERYGSELTVHEACDELGCYLHQLRDMNPEPGLRQGTVRVEWLAARLATEEVSPIPTWQPPNTTNAVIQQRLQDLGAPADAADRA